MLTAWPLASWAAALKLWPALSRCTPTVCSVRICVLNSAHLLRQASQNIVSFSPSPSLILHLFPPPNFSIVSLYPFHSACPSIKASSSPNSRALMSVRGERGVLQWRRTCSFVSYYTSQGAAAVYVYQPLLLPPPNSSLLLTQIPVYYLVCWWFSCKVILMSNYFLELIN